MNIRSIKNIDINNKRVFIRCDFNVPIDSFGNILDDRRIMASLPTIRYCLDRNCKVILASHLGRPKGIDKKLSLVQVAKRLSSALAREDIIFANSVVGDDVTNKVNLLKPSQVLLLENLRFESGEVLNDEGFAKKLSCYADIFINDAFGVSHREHASIVAIVDFFNKDAVGAGFLLQKEINFYYSLVRKPIRPLVAIIGGSKVGGKLKTLIKLLNIVDKMIVGGGMAFTFLKARGFCVGKSLVENHLIDDASYIMNKAKELKVKFYLPVDVVVADNFIPDANIKYVTSQEIPSNWQGLDIGPSSITLFKEALYDAKTILWNGPMGVFEMERFSKGSIKMSHAVADSYATTFIGGGDTASLVSKAGDDDDMTFISTGGGASLELLEKNELVGIKPLLIA